MLEGLQDAAVEVLVAMVLTGITTFLSTNFFTKKNIFGKLAIRAVFAAVREVTENLAENMKQENLEQTGDHRLSDEQITTLQETAKEKAIEKVKDISPSATAEVIRKMEDPALLEKVVDTVKQERPDLPKPRYNNKGQRI